jgi:putative oxidoreductase
MRLVVGWAFYASGLTKVMSSALLMNVAGHEVRYPTSIEPNASAVMLFEHEYSVPFLDPALAAQLGTAAEIVLPLLLIFGLFGRLSALGLFVFNIVAVLSYEAAQVGPAFYLHIVWGTMLLSLLAHGPGKISIDYLFTPKKRR